jgi:hypothetical protein
MPIHTVGMSTQHGHQHLCYTRTLHVYSQYKPVNTKHNSQYCELESYVLKKKLCRNSQYYELESICSEKKTMPKPMSKIIDKIQNKTNQVLISGKKRFKFVTVVILIVVSSN